MRRSRELENSIAGYKSGPYPPGGPMLYKKLAELCMGEPSYGMDLGQKEGSTGREFVLVASHGGTQVDPMIMEQDVVVSMTGERKK